MPAARTRSRRARKPQASQPPVLRLPWMDAYSAMRAVGLSWYAWVADAEARLPGIVNRAGFDASLTVSRAAAEAAKADAAAQVARAHAEVHSGRPIPEHMTGGCGEGDPGTSNIVPLPSSPWLPRGQAIPVSDTRGNGWTSDEVISRHLEAIGYDGVSWGRLSPVPDIAPLDPDDKPPLPAHEPRQDDEALDRRNGNGLS